MASAYFDFLESRPQNVSSSKIFDDDYDIGMDAEEISRPIFHQEKTPIEKNFMENYTFYTNETRVLSIGCISSSGFLVFGVVSNGLTMAMLNLETFSRTSFKSYFQWICSYHILSLMLTTLRHYTLSLDMLPEDVGNREQRFLVCNWLQWFTLEIDHCTEAALVLLIWNRIWCQRNLDRFTTDEDAMRYPVLWNVIALLLSVTPASAYIEGLQIDAEENDLHSCSFTFIHKYGSPRLLSPFTYLNELVETCVLVVSLLALIGDVILKVLRRKCKGKLKLSGFVSSLTTTADSGDEYHDFMSDTRSVLHPSSANPRKETKSTIRPSMGIFPQAAQIRHVNYYEDRDHSVSKLTIFYILIYLTMGTPIKIVPYLIKTERDDFATLMTLHLLRQAFQASTLIFLYSTSELVRESLTEMAAATPIMRYNSSAHLLETKEAIELDVRKSIRWAVTNVSSPDIRTTASAMDDHAPPGHIDRLELGLHQMVTPSSKHVSLAQVNKSPSATTLDVELRSAISTKGYYPSTGNEV